MSLRPKDLRLDYTTFLLANAQLELIEIEYGKDPTALTDVVLRKIGVRLSA